jgi:hypothetical protein
MSESIWTAELVDALTRAWNAGESVNAIASRMGLTRNQVLGKVHRLGLEQRGQPESLANRAARVQETAATGGCRWIEGNNFVERLKRGEQIYCGKTVATVGSPWCKEHHARVWVPVRRRVGA